jgi:predicted DNA-binding protein
MGKRLYPQEIPLLSIRLTYEDDRQLDALSERTGWTRSRVVRKLIHAARVREPEVIAELALEPATSVKVS